MIGINVSNTGPGKMQDIYRKKEMDFFCAFWPLYDFSG